MPHKSKAKVYPGTKGHPPKRMHDMNGKMMPGMKHPKGGGKKKR